MAITELEIENTAKRKGSPTLEEILAKLYNDEIICADYGIQTDETTLEKWVEVITQKGYKIKITINAQGGYKLEETGGRKSR